MPRYMVERTVPNGLQKRTITTSRMELIRGGLLLVAGFAWAAVIGRAQSMGAMGTESGSIAMVPSRLIDAAGLLAYLAAWGAMMVAMMLPSALPMVLLYARVSRNMNRGSGWLPTGLFLLGYMVIWAAIGLPLYLANQALTRSLAVHPQLGALAPYGIAGVLAAAGIYQFTPLKRACLKGCQSPLQFLMDRWQSGLRGSLRLSLRHALYCLGCCWGLIAVLVVAGAMGLVWVITIALLVFAEKLLPAGELIGRVVGVALLALGLAVAVRPELSPVLAGGGGGPLAFL